VRSEVNYPRVTLRHDAGRRNEMLFFKGSIQGMLLYQVQEDTVGLKVMSRLSTQVFLNVKCGNRDRRSPFDVSVSKSRCEISGTSVKFLQDGTAI